MGLLNFTYNTPGYLAAAVFTCSLLVYLWTRKDKTAHTRLLIVYFFLCSILTCSFSALSSTYLPERAHVFNYAITAFVAFSNSLLILFFYNLPENVHPRESRIAFTVSLLLGISAFFFSVHGTTAVAYDFETQLLIFPVQDAAAQLSGGVVLLTHLWILAVIVRKIVRATDQSRFRLGGSKAATSLGSFGLVVFFNMCLYASYALYRAKII